MISINPLGGLCNRMRALDSALALAAATGQMLDLRWELSEELNCNFSSLFAPVPAVDEIEEVSAFGRSGRLLRRVDEHLRCLRGQRVLAQDAVVARAGDPVWWLEQGRAGRMHIATHSRFFKGPEPFALLRPVAPIAQQIDDYRARLAGSIGVHIRRTDNAQAMARSPLSCFIDLMTQARDEEEDVEFFVASDDPVVLKTLQSAFGTAVWWHPKQAYERDDPAAIREAMVDLFCLASCRYLIGSYWSSFTDTAAELYGIDCRIALADAQPAGETLA